MAGQLDGKRIAILATDGVEQAELLSPQEALMKAGAKVDVISLKTDAIQGFDHITPDKKIAVDKALESVDAADYDGLVLPGGAQNPDRLRTEPAVQAFVRAFFEAGKPVGASATRPGSDRRRGGQGPHPDQLQDHPPGPEERRRRRRRSGGGGG